MKRERISFAQDSGNQLPDWKLAGPVLVRLAAFPAGRLDAFAMPASLDWLRRLDAQARLVEAARTDVCERVLYQAAGQASGRERSLLVAIKRKLYNGQPLLPDERATLAALLGLRPRRLVRRYALHLERLDRWKREAAQAFGDELALKRQRLQELVVRQDFLRGLQLHNASLAQHARKLARVAPAGWRKAERNTETTLMRYLARATVKTSPFGRWGLVGALGDEAPDDAGRPVAGLRLDTRALRVEVRSRLNLQLCTRVATALHDKLGLAERLPLTPNPTCFADGAALGFLGAAVPGLNLPFTRLRSGPASASVRQLLDLLQAAPRGLRKAEWLEQALRQPALAALGAAAIAALIVQMQRTGLAVSASLLPSDSPDGLAAFASGLRTLLGGEAEPWCAALDELDGLGRAYAGLDAAARDGARTRIAQLCEALGVTDGGAIPPVIEDSVAQGLRGSLGPAFRQSLQAGLGPLLALYARRDSDGRHQRLLVDIFVASYGVGGRCAHPAHFTAQVMRLCQQHQPDDAAVFPRFAQARAVHERFMQALAALCREGGDEVDLGAQDLRALAQTVEPDRHAGAAPRRLGMLVQLAARDAAALERGDFDIVLNQTLPGWSRFHARYAQLFDDAAWTDALRAVLARLQEQSGAEVLELQTTLQHNGHLHPVLTERALAMPGEASARAGLLPMAGLRLEHDAVTDTLHFTYEGKAVLPLYMGCLHTMSLPPLQRVLADAGSACAYQAEALKPIDFMERQAAPHARPVRAYPRLRHGRVVLQRRSWAVDIEALPAPVADGLALLGAFQAWQAEHGLPRSMYVRVLLRKAGVPARSDDHKPVYLDVGNLLLLRSFVAGLERDSIRTLVFEEALPAPATAFTDLGQDGRHVIELQLELEEAAS
jgi:hypothetical protein